MLEPFRPRQSASPSAYAKQHGRVDVQALWDAMDAQIAATNKDIRAFAATQPITTPDARTGPLMGLPVGIKDIIATADLPTQMGSPIYQEITPIADAAIVSLIKRAGGQVCHKTVTTEFAYLHPNVTRNPHNLNHTPGGSSSGSAAAVAAGYLPFALGTQTGGSVIRPACYCGVFGFKPSFTALPMRGVGEFSRSLDTLGLFTANLDDMALFWGALTDMPAAPAFDRPLRIGLMKTHIWDAASADAQQALTQAAMQWERAGAEIVALDWPDLYTQAFQAHEIIQNYEACRALGWEMAHHADHVSPMLLATLKSGVEISHKHYLEARHTATAARAALRIQQAELDVILTPSAPSAAPEGLGSTGVSTFNRFWTLMGVPCLHMPAYQTAQGLPIGVQLVGSYEADSALLAAAFALWDQL